MHRKHCLKFFTLVLLSLVLSCCQDQLVSDWSSEGSLGVNVRRTSNPEIRGLEEARNFYMNSERILASASSRAEGEKEVKILLFPLFAQESELEVLYLQPKGQYASC